MPVQFKKTGKGEVAILPRKEYEALVAKAAEADEDAGTARLVARARKEIAEGGLLSRSMSSTGSPTARIRSVSSANGGR